MSDDEPPVVGGDTDGSGSCDGFSAEEFAAFYRSSYDDLRRFLHRQVAYGDIEALAHEACARTLAHWPGSIVQARKYAFTVAHNLVITVGRRDRRVTVLPPDDLVVVAGVDESSPERAVYRRELVDAIYDLSEPLRDAMLLVAMFEFPVRDAAKVLGIKPRTLSYYLGCARRELRKRGFRPGTSSVPPHGVEQLTTTSTDAADRRPREAQPSPATNGRGAAAHRQGDFDA